MARFSKLFSTLTPKSPHLSLHSQYWDSHNMNTSLSSRSGQRDISLREVAADSIRDEAQPANDAVAAVACLPNQLLLQGISMIYYSIPEVAKNHLKVSRSTIYRLIESGDLKLVHFRSCARITATSLEAYCARRGNVGA
jgi:excisionase family DNA binding protein